MGKRGPFPPFSEALGSAWSAHAGLSSVPQPVLGFTAAGVFVAAPPSPRHCRGFVQSSWPLCSCRTEPGAVWLPQGSALGQAASCRFTQPCGADGHCPPGLLGHAPPSGAQGKDADPKKTRDGSKCGCFRSGWRLRGQDLRGLSCAVPVLDGSGLRASGGPRANPAAPSRCVMA